MALDDLFDEFDKFELEGATKLSPRDYAKYKGMRPQMVYYYIRQGVIDMERCVCGRNVVDVEQADEALSARAKARGK
jgi:hypothetical protein